MTAQGARKTAEDVLRRYEAGTATREEWLAARMDALVADEAASHAMPARKTTRRASEGLRLRHRWQRAVDARADAVFSPCPGCCTLHADGTLPRSEPCVERASIETAEIDVARDCIALMEVMDKVRVSDAIFDWEAMSVAAKRVADSTHRYAQARLAARRA